MPTEKFEKGKIYFKGKDDEEYKELGIGTALETSLTEDKEINNICDITSEEFTFNIKTKKYRRKRFKKLLMSKGVQRNEADIYSRTFCRTQLELDMFFGNKLKTLLNSRKKVEK